MSGASDLVQVLDDWGKSPMGQSLGKARDHVRTRLPVLLGLGLIGFLAAFPFTSDVVQWLIAEERLPDGVRIIVTTPVEFLLLQVRLAADVGLGLILLVLLSDLFRAAARGSTPAMKDAVAAVRGKVNLGALALLVLSAVGLAVAGLLYASTGLVPLLLDYLTNDAQSVGLSTDWRLIAYVSFLVRLHLASAVGFQAPLVTLAVLRGGLVDRSTLVAHRRHVWFGCVVMGAFVSPPDPLSLFLVALPVVLLFEVGLIIDRLLGRAPASA